MPDQPPGPSAMRLRDFGLTVAVSVLVGLVFHAAWVVLFIFASSQGAARLVKVALWLLAPVISATGFGAGLSLVPHGTARRRTPFRTAYRITLIGCAIGAAIMSPLGPMIVGFGVLAGGTMGAVVQCFADERGMRVLSTPRKGRGDREERETGQP